MWHGWCTQCVAGEALDHVGESVAAIVAVLEGRQVARHVFGTDGVVGSALPVLEIAEFVVDPLEGGHGNGARPGADGEWT